MRKLLFFVAEDWFFCSHFLARARAAQAAGLQVAVLTRVSAHGDVIRSAGLRLIPLELRRSSVNPFYELGLLHRILQVYRRERPDFVHQVALKPVIYGTLAARLLGLRGVINAPVGMGYVFSSVALRARLLRPLVRGLLRAFLHRPGGLVVFENPDDMRAHIDAGAVPEEGAVLIRGAGVDTEFFRPTRQHPGTPVVTLAARMLRDKGVEEFVAAARALRASGVAAHFRLAGAPDPENPASIDEAKLRAWHDEGVVEWLGHCSGMAEIWQSTDIACLPSYREGLTKALLEALASGLPIVTTDVPGCRETVEDGVNGLLVPARDSARLAEALGRLVADVELRLSFGAISRQRAVSEFSDEVVITATLQLYQVRP